MKKQKHLGQHFLNSSKIADLIVFEATISKSDIVYEIGTGCGILTPLLCKNAKRVVSIDSDRQLYEQALSNFADIENLTLQYGDGFKQNHNFTVFVSNLPYSKSRHAIEWLAQTRFSHGVIMVQKEFAGKLFANSASERKAVSVIAKHAFEMTLISNVGCKNFDPPPRVDSVLLKIRKKITMEKALIQIINKMFSYRKKKIKNILGQFGVKTDMDKRLDDLSSEEIISIAKQIREHVIKHSQEHV